MKRFLTLALCGLVIFTSCGNMSNLGKGALIGTGAGAALGAGVGAIFGGQKGAAIGAAIGTAVGAGTGAVIGDVMDRKAKELEEALDASVETVTDANGLEAIKVTFDSGILFDTNKYDLKSASKAQLCGILRHLVQSEIFLRFFQRTFVDICQDHAAALSAQIQVNRHKSVICAYVCCSISFYKFCYQLHTSRQL